MTGTRSQIPGRAGGAGQRVALDLGVPVGEPGLADLVVDGIHDGLHSVAATAEDLWTGVRLWFSFTGQAAGTSAPNSTVTIHCDETNQDFIVTLSANSIARPTVAAMLVLDQSGSMDDQAGATGVTRIQALRESAELFVDVIQPGNGVGLVRFDTVAYPVNDPTYPGLAVMRARNLDQAQRNIAGIRVCNATAGGVVSMICRWRRVVRAGRRLP